jgi:hypothetical protein
MGWGVRQDYREAMTWYRKAADRGYATAQSNIGWLYHNGWGVKQDYGEAMTCYRKAADQGDAARNTTSGRSTTTAGASGRTTARP